MTFSNESPFSGPVPDSVPLPQTPLTGVLVQIVFQGRVMDLATRAYGFFRWVVNDDFLKAFGGQP